jgi:hypothetical protein
MYDDKRDLEIFGKSGNKLFISANRSHRAFGAHAEMLLKSRKVFTTSRLK